MDTFRVGIIGSGYIADFHVRALQKLNNVSVDQVCSKTTEHVAEFAQRHGIENFTTDAKQLLEHEGLDAVVIATPNVYHAPFAVTAIEKGKHVFIEKPIATNYPEAEKIRDAAQKFGKKVMSGYMWRFNPEVRYLKRVIGAGMLGDIIKTKGYGIHVNWAPGGWFVQKELAGGGALADMGVHAIDTIRFCLGDPLPALVYAKVGTYYGNYDVEDSVVVMITWDNNTVSIIESGWNQPHMDGPEAASQVFGTKGYASLFPVRLKVKIEGVWGDFVPSISEKKEHINQEMYDEQMKMFIHSLQSGEDLSPGINEGLLITRIVDAAYRSSESGKVLEL